MSNLIKVNKLLTTATNEFLHNKCRSFAGNKFTTYRSKFNKFLNNKGFNTFTEFGNYITVSKNNNANTFYFSYHAPENINYLIPENLTYKVDYFAFYDEINDCIYKISFSLIHEYCKTISKVYKFKNKRMILLPDTWVHNQAINVDYLK